MIQPSVVLYPWTLVTFETRGEAIEAARMTAASAGATLIPEPKTPPSAETAAAVAAQGGSFFAEGSAARAEFEALIAAGIGPDERTRTPIAYGRFLTDASVLYVVKVPVVKFVARRA